MNVTDTADRDSAPSVAASPSKLPSTSTAEAARSEVHPGWTNAVIIDPPVDEYPARRDESVEQRLARRRATGRRWRARLMLVVIVGVCVAVGIVKVRERMIWADRVSFTDVTLVGDPIDIVTTSPASVVSIAVRPGETVTAGTVLATLDVIRPAPAGGEQRVRTTLTAPVDAVVVAGPTNEGAALLAGGPVIRLYEPDKFHFEIELSLSETTELRIGQRGMFSSDNVDPVAATLVSIEPGLSPGRDGRAVAVATLMPDDSGDLRHLLVGLSFEGWLDTTNPDIASDEATPES